MPSVTYAYTAPFVETVTETFEDENGETQTVECEQERVPIRLYTRKWMQTGSDRYRLWLTVTVTDFGDRLLSSGVPDNATAPNWWNADSKATVSNWADAICCATLPNKVIVNAVDATVESITAEIAGDDSHATIDIQAPNPPVTAELGAVQVTFDPRGDA